MKKFTYLILFISFIATGCSSSRQVYDNGEYNNQNYSNAEISYQTFYDQLQPYGNWIDNPQYGYVWQPNAGADFRPYETNGHWVSTVDGWAWASNYNWGWAPFHYGRWMFDEAMGWMWVPGHEWAPAWVTWGQYNNYYAWAPLAPGINIGIGNTWRPSYNYWSFVPNNYIQSTNLNRFVVRNNYNTNIVNNITIINNYNSYNNNKEYYHRGPDYHEVEQFTHKSITPLPIAGSNTPGVTSVTGKQYQVYRPAITRNNSDTRKAAPTVIRNMNEVRLNDVMRNNNGQTDGNSINSVNPTRPYNNNNGVSNLPAVDNRQGNINRPESGAVNNPDNQNNGTINQNKRFSENSNILNERQMQQQLPAPDVNRTVNPDNKNSGTINQNKRFSEYSNILNQRQIQQQQLPAPDVNRPVNPANPGTRPPRIPSNQIIRNNPPANTPQTNSQPAYQNNRNLERVENWRLQRNQGAGQQQPQGQNRVMSPNRALVPQSQPKIVPLQRPERAPVQIPTTTERQKQ